MSDNGKTKTMTYEQIAALCFAVAGVTSVPFMRDHPKYVMPTEEISNSIAVILHEHGINLSKIHGYGQAVK